MKRIKLVISQPLINRVVGSELNLLLNDKASLVNAINEVDKMINSQGKFPMPNYQSLLHMIYNPIENRFYKQVAATAYKESGQMLNVRDDPKKRTSRRSYSHSNPCRGLYKRVGRSSRLPRILESDSGS